MKDPALSNFTFKAKLWKYRGKSGWFFVTIPISTSKKIRALHKLSEEGWGRLRTTACIGKSTWTTAVWFDTKAHAYLLPVKIAVRKSEHLSVGSIFTGRLEFEVD